jgi:hypothetical protein
MLLANTQRNFGNAASVQQKSSPERIREKTSQEKELTQTLLAGRW